MSFYFSKDSTLFIYEYRYDLWRQFMLRILLTILSISVSIRIQLCLFTVEACFGPTKVTFWEHQHWLEPVPWWRLDWLFGWRNGHWRQSMYLQWYVVALVWCMRTVKYFELLNVFYTCFQPFYLIKLNFQCTIIT